MEKIRVSSSYLKKKQKEETLFIYEDNLDKCPQDYIDCVMFIAFHGIDQNIDRHVLILDEKGTNEFQKLLEKELIDIIVIKKPISDNPSWQIKLIRERNPGNKSDSKLFLGGEMLRRFCDAKNIFYVSYLNDEKLLSASNFMYEKKAGEDCRIPIDREIK
jgi:hypothetical protein